MDWTAVTLREKVALLLARGHFRVNIAATLAVSLGTVRYHERIIAGLCGTCGLPRGTTATHEQCPKCRAKIRQRDRVRRAANHAEGMCQCGRTPMPGRKLCTRCISYFRQ